MTRSLLTLTLAAVIGTGIFGSPAAAGNLTGCCICQGCATPPATQCFENPALGCQTQCSILNCAEFSDTSVSCGEQTQCATFSAPAPAPSLAPAGLGIAALLLAGIGRRALRRRI